MNAAVAAMVIVTVLIGAAGITIATADHSVCDRGWRAPSPAAAAKCDQIAGEGDPLVATVGFVAAGMGTVLMGWFVVRRGHLVGALLLVNGASIVVGVAAEAYHLHAVTARAGPLPAAATSATVGLLVFNNPSVFVPLGLAILLFPTGRLPSPRWRPFAIALVAGGVVAFVGAALETIRTSRFNQGAGATVLAISDIVEITSLPMIAVGVVASLTAPLVRLRRADEDLERRQVRSFLRGVVAVAVLVGLSPLVFALPALWPIWPVALASAFAAVPVMLGLAIVRDGLYALDRSVNRAVVYGVLTAGVVILYVGAVTAAGELVSRRRERLAELAVTGLVAVAFNPSRVWLQRQVDRLLFGYRREPHAAAASVATRLRQTSSTRGLLADLAASVADALRLPYVAVQPASNEADAGLFGQRDPSDAVERFDLVHRGSTVGWMEAAPRRAGTTFEDQDLEVLESISTYAAVAVQAAILAAEVERSHQRLIETRLAEQLRIRRDLHDGLGPALTGIGLAVGDVEDRASLDRDRERLGRVREEVSRCLAEIRRIAHDLQPTALDGRSLVDALRHHAGALSNGALSVEVDAPGLPELPGEVERAAFRIISEAVTNVHRHAGASRCHVRLSLPDQLVIEVSDNGRGLEAGSQGFGLESMQARVRELGGHCTISGGEGGGTSVLVHLPVDDQ